MYVAIAVGILLFLSWSRRRLSEVLEESKRREMVMGGKQENAELTTSHGGISFPTTANPPHHPSTSVGHEWESEETHEEHGELSEEEELQVDKALKKKSSIFSSLMTVFILVIAAINYFLKTREELAPPPPPPPSPSEQRAAPEPEPEQARALEHSTEEAPASEPAPENETAVEPEDLQEIRLSFSQDFILVKGSLPYTSSPYSTRTVSAAPPSIHRRPGFQGREQRYGEFLWGTRTNATYPFLFDLHPEASERNLLYIDLNQNGDLTDDGEPLRNTGSGVFAASLKLPSQQLFHSYQGLSQFEIWIFINEEQARRGYVGHYSRTQAKATLQLDGQLVGVQIVDHGNNDADFRNDGIYIDANLDGSIDSENEYVSPGDAISIGERPTRFQITE